MSGDRNENSPAKLKLVITVNGLHGTGKSTQAKLLAEALCLRYVSAGEMFRQMAEERGMTLEDMSRIAEDDFELDKMVDERTKQEACRGGVVIDAALSGWMAADANIKIFLTAPLDARIGRIARRDCLKFEEAKKATQKREEIERERFMNYYRIDITDLSIYDVILNTELYDAEGTARILKNIVKEYISEE